jgi:hypothetical protein
VNLVTLAKEFWLFLLSPSLDTLFLSVLQSCLAVKMSDKSWLHDRLAVVSV